MLLHLLKLRQGVQGALHHDEAEEARVELLGHPAVEVGMVPVGSRRASGDGELVKAAFPRRDHGQGIVHAGGDVQAMEVEIGGLREAVDEGEPHPFSLPRP